MPSVRPLGSNQGDTGVKRSPKRSGCCRAQSNPSQANSNPGKWQQVLRGVSATVLAAACTFGSPDLVSAVSTEQLLFLEAWRAVDRAYVDKTFNGQSWFKVREQYLKSEPMRDRAETYAAIRKLMASLDDPFTRFLEPERYAQLRRGAQGSVTGVGLEVAFSQSPTSRGQLLVVAPVPGGPADRASIRAQDTVLAIDGRPTEGQSLYDVANELQGEVGSTVTITLREQGSRRERTVELTRERVQIAAVSSEVCGPVSRAVGAGSGAQVGVIRISTFNKQTAGLFLEQLDALQRRGVTDIVLDLRNNGGGYFPAGVQVARSLIESGDIVLIADSKGVKDIYSSDGSVVDAASQLAVLVNNGTASAAEVLAGALKDNGRATVVGTNTFGKGLIQSVVPLDPDDGSAVVVTVARYQTPKGIDINKVGITPDLPLQPEALPPAEFCKILKSDEAPRLYK